MELLKEYAEHANACRQLAARARSEAERDHLLEMARRWEELARQRAAYQHLEDVLADLLKSGNHNGQNGQNGGTTAA